MHQSSLSRVYGKAIYQVCKKPRDPLTQSELIRLLNLMIAQNKLLDIGLDLNTWHKFFEMFYLLRHHQRDGIICRLLGKMHEKGSSVKPDLTTFNVILHGVSTNDDVKPDLIDLIMNDVMPSHGICPDFESQKSRFRVLVKTWNIDAITVMILDHSEYLLQNENMYSLNFIVTTEASIAGNIFNFLAQCVIPSILRRTELMNAQTYKILSEYYRMYPQLRDWILLNAIFREITVQTREGEDGTHVSERLR